MIIQGSHAPCPIPYHTFFPNRMLIGKLMYPLRLSKTYPSFLNLKEGSTFLTKPLFPQEREDVTALWCSEPLHYKVGGPSKVYAKFCGMGPHGALAITEYRSFFSSYKDLNIANEAIHFLVSDI